MNWLRMSARDALVDADCAAKQNVFADITPGMSSLALQNIFVVMAADSCLYPVDIFRPFCQSDDPVTQGLALKAAAADHPEFVRDCLARMASPVENLFLQHIIDEIKAAYEAKASGNP